MSKLKIKKDDMVLVMAGNSKDRKTNGKYPAPHKVLKVLVKENMAIVEGVNMVTKSTKPSAAHPQGGLIKQEAPIHISNLSLVDPKTGEPTRVAINKDENGKKVRISKKSGEVIK
ncbi:MAG: 50S ribosomal protein L24 [Prevotella sp.]|nr:50S ribosomal protein L24 [Prevotella sp.]MDY5005175.1 50S ribosomal protein L24 [Prevotella sp.]MDY5125037.1 50S ribosomal protein L24 [Prevotella sp.]